MKKGKILISVLLILVAAGAFLFFKFKNSDKAEIIQKSLSVFEKVSKFLPIEKDTQKEIETINKLAEAFNRRDGVERKYMLMLQNNMELRPGGGFLGQYAIVKIKDGQVTSLFIEDANLLDQRIHTKVTPPYPFTKMMSLKKWKFRDSNFSPDFPTNVDKAGYFYRLSGGDSNFDGVIAINASVLNNVLALTGPITVPGYAGEYNSENAVLKLEEQVEKVYLANAELDTTNRKAIMKKMAPIIVDKLLTLGNVTKVADFALEQARNKDVMFYFKEQSLQKAVQDVHWSGEVANTWDGDYLMVVDANMGALKSDYYIKREMTYEVDLTGEKPMATLNILYRHTATHGDWRTSDYHSYLRVYTPKGSNLVERKMVSYPNVQEEFGKTYFGFTLHALIAGQTNAYLRYELPESIRNNYKLLIQKQSGVGDVPIKIKVKTKDGEFNQDAVLEKDLKFEFAK